jgi:A/G-specific adenine glycosylase
MDAVKLIEWFCQNKRDLPWRQTTEPYKIWLSEIILQQTQVAQGLPYYQKFLTEFPTVQDLAAASEQEVLNLWQGLGYYSRARNLHFTAKDIVQNYQGIFPKTYKELLKLKGVGEYTAAAIASFCHNEPVAVLDGNVFRVLSRLNGIDTPINTTEGKKIFKKLAHEALDVKQPAVYNQAIMEFGALHCTPANPKCATCPLSQNCLAYQTGLVDKLPVKLKKLKIKKRFLNYYLVEYQDSIILQKRKSKGIWQNLYQLPLIETAQGNIPGKQQLEEMARQFDIKFAGNPQLIKQSTHKLTHQHLMINFWRASSLQPPLNSIAKKALKHYPVPVPIANFLKQTGFIT